MSLIKRFILLALGLVVAFYAVQVGVMVPWTSPISSWTGDTFSRYDFLLVFVSVVAVVATAMAIWSSFDQFAKDVQKTYVSTADICIDGATLIVSSLALGMHLKPTGTNPVDWFLAAPFAWQVAIFFVLMPAAFILLNLEIEIFVADSAHEKRLTEQAYPVETQVKGIATLLGTLTTTVNTLADNLGTHRTNMGERFKELKAADETTAKSLNAVNKALTDVLARLPPPAPKVVEAPAEPKAA